MPCMYTKSGNAVLALLFMVTCLTLVYLHHHPFNCLTKDCSNESKNIYVHPCLPSHLSLDKVIPCTTLYRLPSRIFIISFLSRKICFLSLSLLMNMRVFSVYFELFFFLFTQGSHVNPVHENYDQKLYQFIVTIDQLVFEKQIVGQYAEHARVWILQFSSPFCYLR